MSLAAFVTPFERVFSDPVVCDVDAPSDPDIVEALNVVEQALQANGHGPRGVTQPVLKTVP